MMGITSRNFEGLATNVVDKFFSDGSPALDIIIADVAKSSDLNPNEIKRLVEKSNLQTMLRFLQTSEDKRVEFDMADYDKVMPLVYSGNDDLESSSEITDTPIDSDVAGASNIPDIRKEAGLKTKDGIDVLEAFLAQNRSQTQMQKQANVLTETKHIRVNEIFKMEKSAAELRQVKVQKELNLNNIIDKMATDFCAMDGPDFKKFAQEANELHGAAATPLLTNLAKVMREDITFIKEANRDNTLSKSVIDNTTEQHTQFKEAQEELFSYIKVATQLSKMQELIKTKWDAVQDLADGKRNII